MGWKSPARAMAIGTGLLACLGGCAPTPAHVPLPTARSVSGFMAQEARLWDVAFPVLGAAAVICAGDARMNYGLILNDPERHRTMFKGEAVFPAAPGEVRVEYVHPHFPAAAAGVKAGARVVALNGESMDGKSARAAMELLENAGARAAPLDVMIEQDGAKRAFAIAGIRSCPYPVWLRDQDTVNAYADGRKIVVTTGLLHFVRSADELALVVGHEIAHNAMGHRESIMLGSLLDSMVAANTGVYTDRFDPAASRAFSRESEREADYVGLYIAARAGADLASLDDFWLRLRAASRSLKDGYSTTHPSTPDRFIAFEDTVREIQGKQRKGEPLLPERKKDF